MLGGGAKAEASFAELGDVAPPQEPSLEKGLHEKYYTSKLRPL